MNNLTIAGTEIAIDEHGRYNLNMLQSASDEAGNDAKKPSEWARLESTKKLIEYAEKLSGDSRSAIESTRGGATPGTFAIENLAVEYAGWISVEFRWLVNQTFIDYRQGKLVPAQPQRPQLTQQEFISLAKESYSFLEELGMADDRDRLNFADLVRNNIGGADSTAPQPITISNQVAARGYSATLGQLSSIGRAVARAYREKYGEPPLKHNQQVDGAIRYVNSYTTDHLELIDNAITDQFGHDA